MAAALVFVVCVMLEACAAPEPLFRVPESTTAELERARPDEVGLDAALLQAAVGALPADADHGLRSMLLMRHGKLVFEQYWNGRDAQVLQDLRSVTKRITSLLVGAAIERGLIRGVEEPVQRTLGAHYPNSPVLASGLSVAQWLTMRSGLACNDRDPRSPGHEDTMYRQRDWVGYFLALPREPSNPPRAQYCTGGVVTQAVCWHRPAAVPDHAPAGFACGADRALAFSPAAPACAAADGLR